jgi:hypothetical protein
MKTKNMVDVKFSEFLRRHIFLTSYKVHHLCQFVNKDTNTIVTPARLRKLDNKIEGQVLYAKASPELVSCNGCSSP